MTRPEVSKRSVHGRASVRDRLLQIVLLAVALAAPALPPLWGVFGLLILWFVGYALFRPPRRERWVGLIAVAVAVLGLGYDAWRRFDAERGLESWRPRAAAGYAQLWADLDHEARAAAQGLAPPTQTTERARAFERLAAFAAREAGLFGAIERGAWGLGGWSSGRRSFLLVDPDGEPIAWAGEGLLHELSAGEIPRQGRRASVGFGAVTLFSVEPLGGERRPWRLIAGASYSTAALPLRGAWGARRWSLLRAGETAQAGTVAIPLAQSPTLVVDARATSMPTPPTPTTPTTGARLAWLALALGLFALAALRAAGRAVPGVTGALDLRPRPILPLTAAGIVAAGLAAGLAAPIAAATAACGGVGYLTWWASGRTLPFRGFFPSEGVVTVFLAGAVAALGVTIAPLAIQHAFGPLDLSVGVFADPPIAALRLGLAALAAGLLALAGWLTAHREMRARTRHLLGWLAAAAFGVAGLIPDRALVAIGSLGVGAMLAALWFDRGAVRRSTSTAAAFLILSALASAAGGEVAYRARLRGFAVHDLPPLLEPAGPVVRASLRARLEQHLAAEDLARVAPRATEGLEIDDLAYTLWRRSPLARADALSALVVERFETGPSRTRSTFRFGLPIDAATGEVGAEAPAILGRGSSSSGPWWDARIEGETTLYAAGRPWGRARFVLVLRPGSPAGEPIGVGDVDVGLLRGGPAAGRIERFPNALRFGLYTPRGRAITSPWEEAPALPEAALSPGEHHIQTPSGRALAVVGPLGGSPSEEGDPEERVGSRGWGVIFLPRLGAVAALERVGNAAVGTLALALLAALFALAAALPRSAVRELLVQAVRSYSKRLLLIYGALLLVPLVLLNVVLIRSFERRLAREQRAAGAAALATAQKSLSATLDALEPGYSIETALGDGRLAELAELIHREVNLYWGASVYASSKHELFTAGLLPERIPGEIFAGLALAGEAFSSRINQSGGAGGASGTGGARYLEIYAPVEPAGEGGAAARLFLSVPLLAQQEEAAIELAHIRRQAFLVTVALVALLAAVGGRLARNFTRPIRDLVEGTHRIAGGARALGFAPQDLELSALGRAIDDMAERIAQGREQLVREKQVVERMVDNITSAVISLDVERRVLMHNRVAKELLGVEVGRVLAETLAAEARLAPVARFVRESAGGEAAKRTIRLAPPVSTSESNVGSAQGGVASAGGEREWTLVWVPVPGAGEPAALLVVEDATEELRGQRLLAWAEMARIIAHEIKNPLTPIRLSTEHLREVWLRDKSQFEGVFERCTTNILHQVDELRQIALEFSTYSSVPRIDPVPADLVARIEELVAGYRAAPPEGVEITFEAAEPTLPARFDARLLGRAARNLIENALRASAGGGRVVVRVERLGGAAERARITIADRGPGVSPELLPRIFDPYFSTHDTGTGLGLPIARRIAEEHGGTITARNRSGGGLEVAIEIPLG